MPAEPRAEIELGDGRWRTVKARHLEKNAYSVELGLEDEAVRSALIAMQAAGGQPRIRIDGRPATFVPSDTLRISPAGGLIMLALAEP